VALGLKLVDSDVAQRAVERTRFRMSENKQNFHGSVSDDGELTLQMADARLIRYMSVMHKIMPNNG
jgi:hypothetical protein